MSCCSGFWVWVLPLAVLWWLFASMLVFYTWNHVIVSVTSAKKMQFLHAMLLVFTMMALCAPHHAQNSWQGGCRDRMQMNMMPDQPDHDDMNLSK